MNVLSFLAFLHLVWQCNALYGDSPPQSDYACEEQTLSTEYPVGGEFPCTISWFLDDEATPEHIIYFQFVCLNQNVTQNCQNWMAASIPKPLATSGNYMDQSSAVGCQGGGGECYECVLDGDVKYTDPHKVCVPLLSNQTNLLDAAMTCVGDYVIFEFTRTLPSKPGGSNVLNAAGTGLCLAYGDQANISDYHGTNQKFAAGNISMENQETDERHCAFSDVCNAPPGLCNCTTTFPGYTLHKRTRFHLNPIANECVQFVTLQQCHDNCTITKAGDCNAFSYMAPNGRCCYSLASKGQNFCPDELKDHPPSCVWCNDTHGGGSGDPVIYGFDGGWFHFMGVKNKVFNLISDTHFQLNSKFIHDPSIPDDLTWMGDLGMLIGQDVLNFMLEGTVTLNGNELAPAIYQLSDGGKITIWEEAMAVEIKNYELYFKILPNPTPHFNVHSDYTPGPGSQPHGVLGQTSDGVLRLQEPEDPVVLKNYNDCGARVCKGINAEGCIDGVWTDYEVTGLDGIDFKYNKFEGRRAKFNAKYLLPYEHKRPHIFDNHPFGAGDDDGIVGGTADSPKENLDEL